MSSPRPGLVETKSSLGPKRFEAKWETIKTEFSSVATFAGGLVFPPLQCNVDTFCVVCKTKLHYAAARQHCVCGQNENVSRLSVCAIYCWTRSRVGLGIIQKCLIPIPTPVLSLWYRFLNDTSVRYQKRRNYNITLHCFNYFFSSYYVSPVSM